MKHLISILTLLLLLASVSHAQTEEMAIGNTFGVGARAMGMGGASVGIADDFTALYWNPAGLAQIRDFELFTSFSQNTANTDTYFTGDETTQTSRSQVRPSAFGFVYPIPVRRGAWAIAFGYNRPQNFDYQTAVNGIDPSTGTDFSGLAVDEINRNTGGIGIWSFGTSVYLAKQVLIGGALDFWQGASLTQLETTATDIGSIDSQLASFTYDDEIDREYAGVGGRIGLLAHLTDSINLGVNLVTPVEIGVDELWHQYTRIIYDDGEQVSDTESGAQLYDIERPFEIGTGIAVKLLNEQLHLAADAQLTDWTQARYDPAPADDIANDNFEQYYQPTLQLRLGTEYRLPHIQTYLRLGYFRDTFPFTEVEVENARDFFTLGIGKNFEKTLQLDIGYMFGTWQRNSQDLTTEQLTHRVFVSAVYHTR